nr:MAG TPA: hypothetical protein [Caudoviricetes sp.]
MRGRPSSSPRSATTGRGRGPARPARSGSVRRGTPARSGPPARPAQRARSAGPGRCLPRRRAEGRSGGQRR